MSPLVLYQNKLLLNDGKLATDLNCCCNKCSYIKIIYDWTFGNDVDLDTKTTFNGVSLGFNCFGGNCFAQGPPGCGDQYMAWSGDNVEQSGTETVVVLAKKALTDGVWNNQTNIELHAWWYLLSDGPRGGPTKVFIRSFDDNNNLCKEVCLITGNLPEIGGGCNNNLIATIIVKDVGGNIDFEINGNGINNC